MARRLRRRAGKPDGSRAKNFLPLNSSIFCLLAKNAELLKKFRKKVI